MPKGRLLSAYEGRFAVQEQWVAEWPTLRNWAVVGVSQDRDKYGNKIYRSLRGAGYHVQAVHPKLTEVEGDPCYPSVADLPQVPDVVDLVIPPSAVPAVLAQCAAKGVTRIWFQPGSESPEALAKATELGLQVVHDACILIQQRDWDN